MSCLVGGKRPSYWKHLSRSAQPRRVGPVLLARNSRSSSTRVKCSISSSMSHCRFIDLRLSISSNNKEGQAAKTVLVSSFICRGALMLLLTLSTPNVNEHQKRGERTFILVIREEIPRSVEK